jgi:dihydropyrimidinase
MADGFASATAAAAAGGNTCVMPFALQQRGTSLRRSVEDYRALAEGECHVDVAFHLIVTDPTPEVLGQELPALLKDGYTSFKVFMTYDDLVLNDRQLLDVFEVARRESALVMVHCEGYDAIRFMTERLERSGQTAPCFHATSRPEVVEREAAHRAISHAELVDVPIVIVHVSGREATEQIRWAQARGLKVFAETCPQYLTLTAEDLQGLDMEGAKYVCSPPPRDRASQEAIWEGLRQGVFQLFSSDHCPFRYEDAAGKLHPKGRTSFRWVPNGIPGVETRLPILFSEGVSKGRIGLNRFVELTATNHAKLYGLYPRKGSIGVGFDADIALWDPNRKEVIRQEILHHGADYTPWEGSRSRAGPS